MSEKKIMNIYQKLSAIQTELKAPKNQYNKFGEYSYRSCEDILEALKPLLAKYNCTLHMNDTIKQIGDRYYVEAAAVLISSESEELITNTAFARETDTRPKMDAAQITGTASSYARKYCLNGLFLIDDTKDADTDEYKKQSEEKKPVKKEEKPAEPEPLATEFQIKKMKELAAAQGALLDLDVAKKMTMKQASAVINKYSKGEEA